MSGLNEDPEKNQKVLDKAYNLYVLGIMCAPNPEAGINNSRSFLRFGWPKVLRYAGVAAAILLLGIAVDHVLLSQHMNRCYNSKRLSRFRQGSIFA